MFKGLSSSFAARLTTPILIGITLLFAATLFFVALFVNNLLREEAVNRSHSALETSTLYINSNLQEVETAITNSSWLVEQCKSDTSMFHYITSKIVNDNPAVVGSIVALNPAKYRGMKYAGYSKRQGGKSITYKNISSVDYDYETMDWFQIPMLLGTPTWSEPYFDAGGADEVITTFSYPLKDSKGVVYAIFTADLSLKWLTSKATSIKPYDESVNLILSRNSSFVVNTLYEASPSETIFSYAFMHNSDSTMIKVGQRMLRGISDDFEAVLAGNKAYGVYGPLDNGWSIMIISSYKDFLRPNVHINIILIIILIIGTFLIAVICFQLIKKLTKPISQFSNILLRIADDKLDNTIPEIKSNDEIKVLRNAIETMQVSIKENNDHRKDIQGARDIQSHIVPDQSFVSDLFELYAMIDPAKEVGGDLYDYHKSDSRNVLYFLVGDVSGKGFPAALFMSMVVSAFRMISRFSNDEKSVVKNINDTISDDNKLDMFVTMFFGCLDLNTLKLKFVNAGHNPPVIVYPDGRAEFIDVLPNLVLGAMQDFEYKDQELQLEKGTRLIVYSDGVTEAENSNKSLYGEERLLKWASSLPADISSEVAVNSLREDVRSFAQSEDVNTIQNDDITIMIITI